MAIYLTVPESLVIIFSDSKNQNNGGGYMYLIEEMLIALLDLTRAKHLPENKTEIAITQAITQLITDKLRCAQTIHILRLCNAIVMAGFSSASDSMESDKKSGLKWRPERSQIYCDCIFSLLEIMKKNKLPFKTRTKVMYIAINISTITAFCRYLKMTQPLPNLLTYEGRNEAALILRPRMPELINRIQSLINQAKKLEGLSRYKEARVSKKLATKLNAVYCKMEKIVLPGLEKKNPSTLTTENVPEAKLMDNKITLID